MAPFQDAICTDLGDFGVTFGMSKWSKKRTECGLEKGLILDRVLWRSKVAEKARGTKKTSCANKRGHVLKGGPGP